jgi:hypothetical protein
MVRVLIEAAKCAEDDVKVLVREEAPLGIHVVLRGATRPQRLQCVPQSPAAPEFAGLDPARAQGVEGVQDSAGDGGGVMLLEVFRVG